MATQAKLQLGLACKPDSVLRHSLADTKPTPTDPAQVTNHQACSRSFCSILHAPTCARHNPAHMAPTVALSVAHLCIAQDQRAYSFLNGRSASRHALLKQVGHTNTSFLSRQATLQQAPMHASYCMPSSTTPPISSSKDHVTVGLPRSCTVCQSLRLSPPTRPQAVTSQPISSLPQLLYTIGSRPTMHQDSL